MNYTGNDNYGKPKQNYINKLSALNDDELYSECKNLIWLSAYAANNPRSDYHWQCDACYDECQNRDKKEIYQNAHTYNMQQA